MLKLRVFVGLTRAFTQYITRNETFVLPIPTVRRIEIFDVTKKILIDYLRLGKTEQWRIFFYLRLIKKFDTSFERIGKKGAQL